MERASSSARSVRRGTWEWEPHCPTPSLAWPLGDTLALLSETVRAVDAAALRRRLGERCERRAVPVSGALKPDDLGRTPEEAAAARLFDGESSPLEVATFSAIDAAVVYRTALLLFETGLLASQGRRGDDHGHRA